MSAPDIDAAPVNFALYFAGEDQRVLPIRPRGKEPTLSDWPNAATTDTDAICGWFDCEPESNYGIETTGLVVVDVDPRHGGHLWLEDNEHRLPESWRFKTGGGGCHLILKAPEGHIIGNRTNIAPGVDIKGKGGMIVGPGSIHPDGGQYQIEIGPDDCEIAVAPDWLVQLVEQPSVNGQAGPCVDLNSGPIPEGSRDDTLTRIAGTLLKALGVEDACAQLHKVNAERCKDAQGKPAPLPEEDVDRIIDSIAKREAKNQNATPRPSATAVSCNIILEDWTVARAYAGAPPPEEPVVEGLFINQTAGVLAAVGGAGKTDVLLDLGVQIVTNEVGGNKWLGYPVEVFGSVVLLTAEDNRNSIHQRRHKLDPMLDAKPVGQKLMAVPVPNLLGSAVLIDQDGQPTDLLHRIGDQIDEIGDVRLFVPDPLRFFCRADINSNPDMATEVMNHFNAFATQHNLLVLMSHHLRKSGLSATTALEAREAIQGVGGIVDHARAVYAFWMPQKARSVEILRELAQNKPDDPQYRVLMGALVKANHADPDFSTHTIMRTSGNRLIDVTARLQGETIEEMTEEQYDTKLADLLRHITTAAKEKRPYRLSDRAPMGVFHKGNLDKLKDAKGNRLGNRKAVDKLIDSLATRELIHFAKWGGGAVAIVPGPSER